MFGEACCSLTVRRSQCYIMSVLSLLLEFDIWDVLTVLFKTFSHVILKVTLACEVSLLFSKC